MKVNHTDSNDHVYYKVDFLKCFITSIVSVLICIVICVSTTYAWFTYNFSSSENSIRSGSSTIYLKAQIRDEKGACVLFNEQYGYRLTAGNKYYVTIESNGQAVYGYYAGLKSDGLEFTTESLYYEDSITFTLIINKESNLKFEYYWGNNDKGAVFFDGCEYFDPFIIADNEGQM